jgi:hypothetical protein
MKQVLIVIALAALLATSGCQVNQAPPYQFSCYNQHAIDAGFCNDPAAGRLVGGVLHDDYSRWGWQP